MRRSDDECRAPGRSSPRRMRPRKRRVGGRFSSWNQARERPGSGRITEIDDPVVQSIGPALPKLHRFVLQKVAAPLRGRGNLFAFPALFHVTEPLFELGAAPDGPALVGRPCPELRAPRPLGEILLRGLA